MTASKSKLGSSHEISNSNLLVTEKYLEDNLMQRTEYDNKGNTIKYVQYDLDGVIINYWEAE